MRVHWKLIISTLSTILVVFIITQWYLFTSTSEEIQSLRQINIDTLRECEKTQAKNLFTSVNKAIQGSLERGEMIKFNRLLKQQKQVKGLNEFSLYDKTGKVTHSSNKDSINHTLPKEIAKKFETNKKLELVITETNFELYQPQIITQDCIRCHIDWKLGAIGGVTHLKFSKETLNNLEKKSLAKLNNINKKILTIGIGSALVFILFCSLAIWISVKKFVVSNLEAVAAQTINIQKHLEQGDVNHSLSEQDTIPELVPIIRCINSLVKQIQNVMDVIPLPIFTVDNKRNILFMNTASKKLTGKEYSKNIDIDTMLETNEDECSLDKCFQNSKSSTTNCKLKLNNEEKHIHFISEPILDSNNKAVAAYHIAIDQSQEVTAKMQADERSNYQHLEVNKLSSSLEQVAKGNLTTSYQTNPHNKQTEQVAEGFSQIQNALENTLDHLRALIGNIESNCLKLEATSSDLNDSSTVLATGTDEMSAQASGVAASTEQITTNISSIAESVDTLDNHAKSTNSKFEQFNQTISDIAENIRELREDISHIAANTQTLAQTSENASNLGVTANSAMQQLETATREIGVFADTIKNIADQTNMLALNATIEAASAGDAGKGFGVVAAEVKELSQKSSLAADEISLKTKAIESTTSAATKALGEILAVVDVINGSVSDIQQSVSKQSIATNEINDSITDTSENVTNVNHLIKEMSEHTSIISRNINEVTHGSREVSSNIGSISMALKDNAESVTDINKHASDLAKMASDLSQELKHFQK